MFYCVFTRFEGFWIEWKQKQKVEGSFSTESCSGALKLPPPPICGTYHPKLPLFFHVAPKRGHLRVWKRERKGDCEEAKLNICLHIHI